MSPGSESRLVTGSLSSAIQPSSQSRSGGSGGRGVAGSGSPISSRSRARSMLALWW
jgi:hypothetical protein